MRTLEELIEQLKKEEKEAHKRYNIDGGWAYERAIELAEQLLEYQKSLNNNTP